MTTARAYAATSPTEPLVATTIERREVGPHDILIDIAYAGVCHSDIHTVRGEWGPIAYPQVVGHEIVGIVAAVGSEVSRHALGDRVGVGCMVNSCRECENCLAGMENYCTNGNVGTYASVDLDGTITQGGYATNVVVNEDFVLRVPESIPYESAAPLLCAGITTYSPLAHWNAGPGKKVAVVGMGGLGHMAVKIAHAMGAEVTVLSQSLSKQEDGLRFGADHYFATSDSSTFDQLKNTFDLIINTVSAPVDSAVPTFPCCVWMAPWSTWAPRPSRCRSLSSHSWVTAVPSPPPASAASQKPRKCWTSAPSTTSPRKRN